uniref:Uncharacterized protein n=1 Tax=Anguilla anguilla TaxID=7936 RepID=A0A0E9TZE6_ANGAN
MSLNMLARTQFKYAVGFIGTDSHKSWPSCFKSSFSPFWRWVKLVCSSKI